MRSSFWVKSTALIILLLGLIPAAGEDKPEKPKDESIERQRAEQSLALCKQGAKEHRLYVDDKDRTELELKPEPILRWSNPSVGSIHGGVFLWYLHGKPAAVASVYKWYEPLDHMACEVHSLSEQPLTSMLGTRESWKSPQAGVKFQPVPGAAAPSMKPAVRLAEMRAIARDFNALKIDRDDQSKLELRLQTQPLARYGGKPGEVADGALFNFVQGTDPEVLLLIETRQTKTGLAWYYALARMNSVTFIVDHKGKEVWRTETLPWDTVFNGKEPYHILKLDHINPKK